MWLLRFAAARGGWRWPAEPPRPAAIARLPWAPWLAVGTVCVGAFMGQLDASIVTLALPTLRREFDATLAATEWVALSYLLVLAAAVTPIGRLADMVGRKLLYVGGFGVFVLGSALCAVAPDLGWLDAARVLQALGAAMLQANSVAIIVHAVPSDRIGRAIGIQGAAQAVGLAAGPAVGGALIALGGWRLIFLVNLPAGVAGMVLGWFLLPRSRGLVSGVRFDLWGAALVALTVAGLMLAITYGRRLGGDSPAMLGLSAAVVLCGVALVAWERHAAAPLLDPALLRRRAFTAGVGSGLLSYAVMFGVLFVVPFQLEVHRRESAALAGLQLSVLPVALGLVAPWAGRLADRVGARAVTLGGMLVTGAGLALLALVRAGDLFAVDLALVGAGLGAFTPANNAAIMSAAPRSGSGVAGGILNMTRSVGTSLGVAATGLVYTASGGLPLSSHSPRPAGSVTHAFVSTLGFLLCLALGSAVLASVRGARRSPPGAAPAPGSGSPV
ncbi:MAG: MFS transporter [Pseudonocardiales bacterium]|nr:MFS transporter [Pseudonocardiales bacterium]